jgi:hypothetical protein
MTEHKTQNLSQMDDVELLVRLDSADRVKDGGYLRALLDEAKNRGLVISFSLHSKSNVPQLQLALGRLALEHLRAILASVTQSEHESKIGLQGAVLLEIDQRKTDQQLVDVARTHAMKNIPFNGDLYFVEKLVERLKSRANETIPDAKHERLVGIMLVKALAQEKPEDTTADKLVASLPKWIEFARQAAEDAGEAYQIIS